jgi:hypothetical protein
MTPLLDLLRRAGIFLGKVLLAVALATLAAVMMGIDALASCIGGP